MRGAAHDRDHRRLGAPKTTLPDATFTHTLGRIGHRASRLRSDLAHREDCAASTQHGWSANMNMLIVNLATPRGKMKHDVRIGFLRFRFVANPAKGWRQYL
jgi:hypothetical protein